MLTVVSSAKGDIAPGLHAHTLVVMTTTNIYNISFFTDISSYLKYATGDPYGSAEYGA
jgi:hypothetical protein